MKYVLLVWIGVSVIFLLVSIVLGARNIRILDFIAYCALAQFPFFLIILFDSISYYINPKFYNPDQHANLFVKIYSGTLDMVAVGLLFWHLILYFFTFKEASGLNHQRTWFGYVIAMILTIIYLTVWLSPSIK